MHAPTAYWQRPEQPSHGLVIAAHTQVCLSNQLKDILEADQARIASGRVPLYLVSQYTHGLASELKAFTGGMLSFALPVSGIRSSLVLLEAAADSISFVTNTSPGRILGAWRMR